MRFNNNAPLTLREFINWVLTTRPHESIRDIWRFEGAYLAGRSMREEHFPMEQGLTAWDYAFGEWQRVMKEVAA